MFTLFTVFMLQLSLLSVPTNWFIVCFQYLLLSPKKKQNIFSNLILVGEVQTTKYF